MTTAEQRDRPEIEQPSLPSLSGRTVYLRAVVPDDYAFLHLFETSSPVAPRWRLRGAAPPIESWLENATRGVLVQFVVVEIKGQKPRGIVTAYDANFQDGYARFAVSRFDDLDLPSPFLVGAGLCLRYLFACWSFRKIYLDVPEYNYHQFASGEGNLFELEGRLKEHSFLGGRYWDQVCLAIYRDRWLSMEKRLLASESSEARA